jgi:hypothetical protein
MYLVFISAISEKGNPVSIGRESWTRAAIF